jgi:hypothetical protein
MAGSNNADKLNIQDGIADGSQASRSRYLGIDALSIEPFDPKQKEMNHEHPVPVNGVIWAHS